MSFVLYYSIILNHNSKLYCLKQVFHICVAMGTGGNLMKHSFLCPNGTVFNQG